MADTVAAAAAAAGIASESLDDIDFATLLLGVPDTIEALAEASERAWKARKTYTVEIASSTVFPNLVQLLKDQSVSAHAAKALRFASRGHKETLTRLIDLGAVPSLCAMLRPPFHRLDHAWASATLTGLLWMSDDVSDTMLQLDVFPRLLELLKCHDHSNPDITLSEKVAGLITNIAATPNKGQLGEELLPSLISLLPTESAVLLEQAAKALSNLAADNNENKEALVTAGVVPQFVGMLSSEEPGCREQGARSMRTIASGSDTRRALVIELGALPTLVDLLSDPNGAVCEQSAGALTNLLAGSDTHTDAVLAAGALAPLCVLLGSAKTRIREQASRAVRNITGGAEAHRETFLETGRLPRVIELLKDPDPVVALQCCGTIINLTARSDTHSDNMVTLGALDNIRDALANSTNDNLRERAAGAIINLTAGSPSRQKQAIEAGLVPQLVELCQSENHEVLERSAWAISCLCREEETRGEVAEQGAIAGLENVAAVLQDAGLESLNRRLGTCIAELQTAMADMLPPKSASKVW